jgi:hypothetical protein
MCIVSKIGGVPERTVIKIKSKNSEVSPLSDKLMAPDQFNKCGFSQLSVPLSLANLVASLSDYKGQGRDVLLARLLYAYQGLKNSRKIKPYFMTKL